MCVFLSHCGECMCVFVCDCESPFECVYLGVCVCVCVCMFVCDDHIDIDRCVRMQAFR